MHQTDTVLEEASQAIERLRRDRPSVHCITNTVAQHFTANVLLACGASPSMTFSPTEAPHFTKSSGALLINLGTLDGPRREAIRQSLAIALDADKPVVIDPVKCDLSPPRLTFARKLLASGSHVLKANKAERGKLGDIAVACEIVTGERDRVATDTAELFIANGSPLMDRIIATGCALGGLVAALRATGASPLASAVAGLVWFGVAGEEAAHNASGPGTFLPLFLDALANLETKMIIGKARVE